MSNITPINEEYRFGKDVIISQTDLEGKITYVNRAFCNVSGYSRDELVDSPHSIVRHPDMPKAVFKKMWETIKGGQAWNGLVKNLRKDGHYYWVETEILPVRDDDENITGFIAVRKSASHKDIIETQETYNKMLEAE